MKKRRKLRRQRPLKERPKIQVEWECSGNEEEVKEALGQAFELILSEPMEAKNGKEEA